MAQNEKIGEILNDLIEINNDRVIGYEKAAKETASEDGDIRTVFMGMVAESKGYLDTLRNLVVNTGQEPADGTTKRGKIYRVWMDVKAAVTGKSRKAILDSCEFGEDAAQRAYDTALEEKELTTVVRAVITEQKSSLKRSHDKIKRLRDTQPA